MDHVVDHVVSPFYEIVEKGKTAVRNAGSSQTMLRTATSLVEEGERALRRITPVCRDNYRQYGHYFVDALQKNDEIQSQREILIGLVWDFDKYVEPGGFNPGKYAQLEDQSRKAAVRIYTILTNMRVMFQPRDEDRLLMSPPSSPLSSPGLPQPPPALQAPVSTAIRGRLTDVDIATNELEQFMRERHAHHDSDDSDHEDQVTAVDQGPRAPRPESPVDPGLLQPSLRRRGQMPAIVRKPRPYLPPRTQDDANLRPLTSSSDSNPTVRPARQNMEAAVSVVEDMAKALETPSAASRGHRYPAVPPSPGLEVPEIRKPYDDGLIVVEPPAPKPKSTGYPSLAKHSTISASSSFYQHKGFCEGAKDVVKGEIGVKLIQKSVQRTLSRVVAKCTSCSFELDNRNIEDDLQRRDDGNFSTKAGIVYRLRFLQKSHLAAKRSDDVPYGCVFCIHQGHTLDPGDATVFFTTQALFNHLARHPRPLPVVPGICVVEEAVVPPPLRNNYDIHLQGPQTKHPAHEHQSDIAGRPTGVARAEVRQLHNKRQPPDRSPALELAQGARITGIRWPREYKGEWMFAWHDGAFESVPTDNVRLDPPPPSDIKMGGSSLVFAKSRWKFAPRDKERGGEWLKFGKNETIFNIGWPYREHWCWSGTNSRGKWGIFPRAFIDMETVQELEADPLDQVSSPTQEKSRTSMFTKLSVRKTYRPSSIAESTSSRDTGGPSLRAASSRTTS